MQKQLSENAFKLPISWMNAAVRPGSRKMQVKASGSARDMTMNRRAFLFGLAAIPLAACDGAFRVGYDDDTAVARETALDWRLTGVRVDVPEELTVSETNSLAPNADIVWRGEAPGDRRAQVGAILQEGIARGFSGLRGRRRVYVRAQLIHFHAVTPQAVAIAPSAVHNIRYALQIFDTQTRTSLTEVAYISADLDAFVGSAAVTAALAGQTQRVRIVDHIARVQRGWLGLGPDQRREFTTLGR